MITVVNTSPLVYLAKLDRLVLLQELFEPCVPQGVMDEINEWSDAARLTIQGVLTDWLCVRSLARRELYKILLPHLDSGESQVIALAVELGTPHVLLDDQDARRFARLYGLRPMGTLGVLLRAKQRGLIAAVKPELDCLAQTNFFVTPQLIDQVLKAAGE